MNTCIHCSGCGRIYRPTSRQRQYGSLGNFCSWGCKSVSQSKAKQRQRREHQQQDQSDDFER